MNDNSKGIDTPILGSREARLIGILALPILDLREAISRLDSFDACMAQRIEYDGQRRRLVLALLQQQQLISLIEPGDRVVLLPRKHYDAILNVLMLAKANIQHPLADIHQAALKRDLDAVLAKMEISHG